MRNKWYWGLAALIILLGTAFIVITIRDRAEIQQPKEQAAETDKLLEEQDKRNAPEVVEGRQPPPNASPNGHWHDGVWHDEPHTPIVEVSNVTQQPSTNYKNNGEYVDIDYSVFDKPEELIAKIGEIKLNREKYSWYEYDVASQEDMILIRKIADGYYGRDEYQEELRQLRIDTYVEKLLAKQGLSTAKLKAMVRGEIPSMIIPIDPAVVKAANGSDK